MTLAKPAELGITHLPDHTELPQSDGTFVFAKRAGGKNFQEHPQSLLLTDSITERSQQLASQLEQQQQKAERLAERLRQLGIEPDDV